MTGGKQVDAGQAGQAFGQGLRQRTGQGRRGSGPRLPGGNQFDGHPGVDLGHHAFGGLVGETQRRHHEGVVGGDERAAAKLPLPP